MRRRPCPTHRALAATAVLLGGLVLPFGASAAIPASAAGEAPCDVVVLPTTEPTAPSRADRSQALARMGVPAAQQVTTGSGQVVAVLDSGIHPGVGIDVLPGASFVLPDVDPSLLSGHGTIVAGLIAGPHGVAPDARIIDGKVFDTESPDEGEVGVTSGGIADGVRRLVELHRTSPFGVANISLSVTDRDDPQLGRAIRDLVARDVVVVASAGNVPSERSDEVDGFHGTPRSDAVVHPADHPGVLAVSAVPPAGEHPRSYVLPNADTDVAAPTYRGLSVNANGQRCDVEQVATSWAAAQVSGVAALLRAAFPRETAPQIATRLVETAEGSGGGINPWTGAGVVQAHDALTRELTTPRDGRFEGTRAQVHADAQAPPAPDRADVLGPARARLLWFGLLAGALMALAFLLRPLFRR